MIFGQMVKIMNELGAPQSYLADMYHDAMWLEGHAQKIEESSGKKFVTKGCFWAVRETGTSIFEDKTTMDLVLKGGGHGPQMYVFEIRIVENDRYSKAEFYRIA